jgi:hypothetical protein
MNAAEFIERFSPPCFFHFTDERNIESIRRHGLLSFSESRRLGIEVAVFGSNGLSRSLDEQRGLDRYVHLCLRNEHPMEYVARVDQSRIRDSWFIPVSKDVLFAEGVRFSPGIANRSGVRLLTVEEACEEMDFEVIYKRTDWRDPEIKKRLLPARKYELLVPTCVALKHLTL